jgi:hypothetical protein
VVSSNFSLIIWIKFSCLSFSSLSGPFIARFYFRDFFL